MSDEGAEEAAASLRIYRRLQEVNRDASWRRCCCRHRRRRTPTALRKPSFLSSTARTSDQQDCMVLLLAAEQETQKRSHRIYRLTFQAGLDTVSNLRTTAHTHTHTQRSKEGGGGTQVRFQALSLAARCGRRLPSTHKERRTSLCRSSALGSVSNVELLPQGAERRKPSCAQ